MSSLKVVTLMERNSKGICMHHKVHHHDISSHSEAKRMLKLTNLVVIDTTRKTPSAYLPPECIMQAHTCHHYRRWCGQANMTYACFLSVLSGMAYNNLPLFHNLTVHTIATLLCIAYNMHNSGGKAFKCHALTFSRLA